MSPTRRAVVRAASAAPLALAAVRARAAAPRPMRLLILGGTGFIGPHQVRYALKRGHHVTVFNRGRRPQAWPGPVDELVGDRNTSDLSALAGKAWDACIDNPTTLPFWVRDAGAVLMGRIGHYVFVSTISVYAKNDQPGADETAALERYAGPDVYAERQVTPQLYGPLKAASEAEARAQFGAGAVTIVRPGLIVGPGDETDRFTYWPVRLANDGGRWGPRVLAPGDGTDPVQFIDARDLAEWTVRMAEAKHAGVFNATGAGMPTKAMLGGVAWGVGAKPAYAWAPAAALVAQQVSGWSDLPVWLPGSGETAGFHRRSIRAAKAAGLTFRPLTVTAADTIAWWRTLPAERRAGPLKAGLTPERETALLAALKAKAG